MSAIKRKASASFPAASTKRIKLDADVPIESKPLIIIPLSDEDAENRFKVIERLGEGGFGIAVKAEDNRTKKSVVVKSFLRYEVDHFTDGIPTEIHIMMSMNHRNIVPMLEAFKSNHYFRMTMPDTNGKDLLKYLPNKVEYYIPSFPYIAHEVAQGLRYLHEDCQVVHLDIKQPNVIIWKEGGEYRIQIIDFGCAKRYSKGVKEFVVDGGTHLFSCKERYTSDKIVGPEADIFSFGVFLFIAFLNFSIYPFSTVSDILSDEEVKLPEVLNDPENSAFRELILNTLTKDTANRWNINKVLSSEWMKQNGFVGEEQDLIDVVRLPGERRTRRGPLVRPPKKLDL